MLRKEKEEGEMLLRSELLFSFLRKRRMRHRTEDYFSLFGAAMLVSVDSHQPGSEGVCSRVESKFEAESGDWRWGATHNRKEDMSRRVGPSSPGQADHAGGAAMSMAVLSRSLSPGKERCRGVGGGACGIKEEKSS